MLNDYKPVVKSKSFVYLWFSQIFSQLAISIMNFLFLITVYSYTQSTIATSLLWISYALPALFFGPIAAATVDSVNRKKMLMVANILQASVVFIYAYSSKPEVFMLFALAFVYSLLNQFYVPAEMASLPSVVKKKYLPQANSLFFLTQQGALVLGFGIAGFLNQYLGYSRTLYLCSFMLLLAFVSVSLLPDLKPYTQKQNIERNIGVFFQKLMEGFRYIRDNKYILFPFILLVLLSVTVTLAIVNAPAIANDLLEINLNHAGLAIAVPAALGAGVGALLVPFSLKKGIRKKTIIDNSLLATLLTLFTFVLASYIRIDSLRIIVDIVLIFVLGLSFVGVFIPTQTFLQEVTPSNFRGRVFGNFWFVSTLASMIPVILSGAATEMFGIRFLLLTLFTFSAAVYYYSRKNGQKIIEKSFYSNAKMT